MLGKLIVVGMAVLNLGIIREADGIIEREFWVRNDGTTPVVMLQGYTSCGCTTVDFPKGRTINVADSARIVLRFNPRGKGGEFYESATVQYATAADASASANRPRVQMALEGTCITSRETLMAQHPHRLGEHVYASMVRFDVGYMSVGERKQRTVSLWHDAQENADGTAISGDEGWKELRNLEIEITSEMPKGINHLSFPIRFKDGNAEGASEVKVDVFVR